MAKINHKQLVKDYEKLISMYGTPDDLTGGMVVEEHLMEAVKKGTQAACSKALIKIIEYGFQCSDNTSYRYGYDGPFGESYKEVSIHECEFIKYISETYL